MKWRFGKNLRSMGENEMKKILLLDEVYKNSLCFEALIGIRSWGRWRKLAIVAYRDGEEERESLIQKKEL